MAFCLDCRSYPQLSLSTCLEWTHIDLYYHSLLWTPHVGKEMLSWLSWVLTNLSLQEKCRVLASATGKALSLFYTRGKGRAVLVCPPRDVRRPGFVETPPSTMPSSRPGQTQASLEGDALGSGCDGNS